MENRLIFLVSTPEQQQQLESADQPNRKQQDAEDLRRRTELGSQVEQSISKLGNLRPVDMNHSSGNWENFLQRAPLAEIQSVTRELTEITKLKDDTTRLVAALDRSPHLSRGARNLLKGLQQKAGVGQIANLDATKQLKEFAKNQAERLP